MACQFLQVYQGIQRDNTTFSFVIPNWNNQLSSYSPLHAFVFVESLPDTAAVSSCTLVGVTAASIGTPRNHAGVKYSLRQTAFTNGQSDRPVVDVTMNAFCSIRIRVVLVVQDPSAEGIVLNPTTGL